MATTPDPHLTSGIAALSEDEFWDLVVDESAPIYEDMGELSMHSIHVHQGLHPYQRTTHSRGSLRLTGQGVTEHRVDAQRAAEVVQRFQDVIKAIASSVDGAKASISKNAEKYARLTLDASPAAGSVVFNLTAAHDIGDEVRPDNEVLDREVPLIDRAFDKLHEVLREIDISQVDEFADQLAGLGPKTAVALRKFTQVTAESHLDVNFRWARPLHPSTRWTVTAQASRFLAEIIEGRELDEEKVTLTGILQNVSTGTRWEMYTADRGRATLDVSEVPNLNHKDFPPTQEVVVEASMVVREKPGQSPTPRYKARTIRPIAGTSS